MKKVASLVGAGAMLLGMALPTFAYDFGTDVYKNFAKVWTNAYSRANTGNNSVHGMSVFGGTISTGVARSTVLVSDMINSVEETFSFGSTDIVRNYASVGTNATARANSGYNSVGGKYVFGGNITTNTAVGESLISHVVNSVVTPTK